MDYVTVLEGSKWDYPPSYRILSCKSIYYRARSRTWTGHLFAAPDFESKAPALA